MLILRGGEKRRRGKENVCILIHTVHWYMATCTYHELTLASVIRNDVFIHVYTCMEIHVVANTYTCMVAMVTGPPHYSCYYIA